jgi:hypothetical protein
MARYSSTTPPSGAGRKRSGTMAELRVRLETALRGRYAVDREVGRGGMAIVYLAHDLQLGRDVALKVLRPELAVTLGPDRFLQEIRLAAGLAHPHILPLHESGEADGLLYYVMPFCTGESLRDRLEREHTLPMADALLIAREVADALAYAHRAGVVHRDIKPENILLQGNHAVVADFGIARAISAAGAPRMTTEGMAVGTREYMSPEQAAGSKAVDGRSDIYSLGCMLFEMLVGSPPAIGTPPEGTIAGSTRATDRAAELAALRPSVPPEVAGVVARMLSAAPGERFQTAGELAEALAAPTGVWTPRSLAAERRRRWGAGVVTVVGLSVAAVIFGPRFLGAGLNKSLYVVAPITTQDSQATNVLGGGEGSEQLLRNAFGRWTGVHVVGEIEWSDLLRRHGGAPPSLTTLLEYASHLGAGHLVMVGSQGGGDSIDVTARVFDVTSHRQETSMHWRFAANGHEWGREFTNLAGALLGKEAPPDARPGALGTKQLSAWRAYVDGHVALRGWELDSAARAFRTALERDRFYPQANLWLAQTLEWQGLDPLYWRQAAERAVAAGDTLTPKEELLAAGLVGLANQQYPDACASYRELVRRDSRDFAGWFGLGECLAKDSLVIRDANSPSHWSFRSSYHRALEAYARALDIAPSANRAFGPPHGRLVRYTEANELRHGYAVNPDTEWFAAYPALDHDTLAFVPYPRVIALGGNTPPSSPAAIAHTRAALRKITRSWVQAFPDDPDACEALAGVLEDMGDLEGQPEENSALAMIRRAERSTRDTIQGMRLGVAEVRLLTKLEEFASAHRVADSLLTAHPRPAPGAAVALAGLAALTGKVHLTAQMLSAAAADTLLESGGRELRVRPVPLARAAFALHAYSAFGAPRDSVMALSTRIERLVDASVEPEGRDSIRALLLEKPRRWAFPLLGARPPERGAPNALQQAVMWMLANGDTNGVRAELDKLHAMRADVRPGDVAITATFLEGRALLAIGDSAEALRLLSQSLDALATLGTGLLDNVDQAAMLVRAMVLRAKLADRAGDEPTARYWGAVVAELWSQADDPELQETVREMRILVVGKKR